MRAAIFLLAFPLFSLTQCMRPCCKGGDQICTKEYAPVKCKDGVTYGNNCEAESNCQFDCVPVNIK